MADMVRGHWRQRRVLLTGATGLVGGWVLKELLQRGAEVVCLVRDQVPQAAAVVCGDLHAAVQVHGTIEDRELLQRVINEYEVTTVLHLAAQTIVSTANRSPISTFETNVRGTWNILEACRTTGDVAAIVVASSDKAYGDAQHLPYAEDHPLRGRHPYDVSKSCADLIAQAYHATYGLPVTITRCGNFYGGGDLNYNRLVPGTIRSALHDERPILRSDGSPKRDYIYVEDASSAYLLLAERTATDSSIHGHAFNFSNERPLSARQMLDAVLSACGRTDLEPIVLDRASNEINDQYLTAEKARRDLGWKPRFDLTQGLERTVSWYSEVFRSQRMLAGAAH